MKYSLMATPALCHNYVPLAKWRCRLPKCVRPFSEFIYYTTRLYHHIWTLLFLTQFIYICLKCVINKSLKTCKLSHWKLLAHLHFLVLKSGPREFGTEQHCSRIKVRCTSYSCSDILSTSSNDGLKRIRLCISCQYDDKPAAAAEDFPLCVYVCSPPLLHLLLLKWPHWDVEKWS